MCIGVLFVSVFSAFSGMSFFLGGVTFLLPQAYFIWKGFRRAGALQSRQIFLDFCVGQLGKMLLSAGLFWVLLSVVHPKILPYFLGFLMMSSMIGFAGRRV